MMRFLDLQLLYGIAGAREKFEEVCAQLLNAKYGAQGVRTDAGDGGIDVFIGDFDAPEGIDVFQVKYFPNGLRDSQKEQVRRSFDACVNNSNFRTKSWTLCVPLDLSQEEIAWFTKWLKKQSPEHLLADRITWWGETDLRTLLLDPANEGIKEAYFPQKHMILLREMLGMLTYLVDDLRTRPETPTLEMITHQLGQRETLIRYRNDVYAPLYRELRSIQHALEQAQGGNAPYPIWICVESNMLPRRFQDVSPKHTSLMFQRWPAFRHDILFFSAFTMAAKNRLDALEQLIYTYNEAIDELCPIIGEILRKALTSPLQKETRQKSYRIWKKGNPREHSPWFEWIEDNTEQGVNPPALRAASEWLALSLGWLLVGNAERAAQEVYEAHQHKGITPSDPMDPIWGRAPSPSDWGERMRWEIELASVNWCKPILDKALTLIARHIQFVERQDELEREEEIYVNWGDMEEWDTYSFIIGFQQAQKALYESLVEITKNLENAMLKIQYEYEGGTPPV